MSKIWSLEKTGASCGQKFVYSDNLRHNIWNKVKKHGKFGQD